MDEKWKEMWKEELGALRNVEPRLEDKILHSAVATHLNTIKGYAELLKKTSQDEEPLLDGQTFADIAINNVAAILELLWALIQEPD